jgi:hypothetical protein
VKTLITSGILGILLFAAYPIVPSWSSQLEKTFVAIHEIGSSVEVVGRLGMPLRKMTSFKAKWIPSPDRSKPESIPLRLKIVEVEKVPVERDVLFLPADVNFVDTAGTEMAKQELHGVIDLFGYEDWVSFGPPIEFDQAIGKPVGGAPEAHGRTQLKAIVQSHR